MTWSENSPIYLPGGKGLIVDGKFNRTAEDCCCGGEPEWSGRDCAYCSIGATPRFRTVVLSGITTCVGCQNYNIWPDSASCRWTTHPSSINGTYVIEQASSECVWNGTYDLATDGVSEKCGTQTGCGCLYPSEATWDQLYIRYWISSPGCGSNKEMYVRLLSGARHAWVYHAAICPASGHCLGDFSAANDLACGCTGAGDWDEAGSGGTATVTAGRP